MSYLPFSLLIILFVLFMFNFCIYYKWQFTKKRDGKRMRIPTEERLETLNKMYNFIQDAASASGTKVFIVYGTLLGKIRQNDIICYDLDLDFGISSHEYERIKKYILKQKRKDLIIDVKDFLGSKSIQIIDKKTNLNADIFPYSINEETCCREISAIFSEYILGEDSHHYPKDWIFPVQETDFLGRKCYIPNKPEKLLETWYSKSYMTPDKVCDSSCMICKKNV